MAAGRPALRQFSLRGPHPQPIAPGGEQQREGDVEWDEIEAARAWLAHVEAGRSCSGLFDRT